MKRRRFYIVALLVLFLAILACSLATVPSMPLPSATMAPTATWTPRPPFPTGTPTATPTWTPPPTLDMSNLVRLPETKMFAGLVVAERELIRYAESVGVEKGTRVYLKVELADGVYVAVFGDKGGMWGLVDMVSLEPTPTATPGDGAEEVLR